MNIPDEQLQNELSVILKNFHDKTDLIKQIAEREVKDEQQSIAQNRMEESNVSTPHKLTKQKTHKLKEKEKEREKEKRQGERRG